MSHQKMGDPPGRRTIERVILVVALALAGQAACRSAGGPPPKTTQGPLADAGRALVGQRRIIRFYGHMKSVSLKIGDLARQSGPCDAAVEIKTAVFTGDAARFSLQAIGRPRLEGQPREKGGKKSPCWRLPAETLLVVSGLEGDSAEKLTAEAGKVLLTPEGYLQIRGIRFDHPAAGDPKEVADPLPTASAAAQRLAEAITVKQRRVLSIDPVYRSENRKVHYEGQVEFVVVVGTDGRVYQPRLTTSLGEHEERVLRVLPLWRYEPARRGDQPVAVRQRDTTIFRIF